MDNSFSNLPPLGGSGQPRKEKPKSKFEETFLATLDQYKDTALSPDKPLFTEYPDRPFGLAESEFFRYANRSNFDELGFSPYRDNEALYNQESNIFGEISRSLHGAMLVGGSTFADMAMGTADLLTGEWESFFSPNTKSAERFQDVMQQYGSRKGGATEFIANNLINVGFMGGMIAESLLEGALVSVATGGLGAIPEFGKIGANLFKAGKAVDAAADVARAGKAAQRLKGATGASSILEQGAKSQQGASSLLKSLADNADNLLKIGGNKVVQFLNPIQNTGEFFGDVLRAAKVGEELPGMAKGAGAMFKDLQLYKAALEESKLEAGFTVNEIKNQAIDSFIKENGRRPNQEELDRIDKIALERGNATMVQNLPVILLTDKLVFGPMLKMGKTTSRVFGFSGGVADDLARRGINFNGDSFFRGTRNAGKNIRETLKVKGKNFARGLIKPSTYLRRGKNILTAGTGEGLQEVFQEVVGGANVDYGLALANDPNAAYSTGSFKDFYAGIVSDPSNVPFNNLAGYFGENVMNQFSKEGLHAFASGMFIGGIVGGGGNKLAKAVKGGSLATKKGREQYQAAKVEQDKLTDELVEQLNNNIKDPMALFNPRVKNHIQQKELIKEYQQALQSQDIKKAKDIMEELRFNQLMTAFETNTYDIFKDKLIALRTLDEQGIVEAVGLEDPKEARQRLEETIEYAEDLKKRYDKFNKKYKNPFNPSAYEIGTEAYTRNQINYRAFENAKRDLIFMEETTLKTKQRQEQIKTELGNAQLTGNFSALDVDVLTSVKNLNDEIALLESETITSEGAQTPEEKQLLKEKKARLKALKNYRNALDKYEAVDKKFQNDSSSKAGGAREEALGNYRKAFDEYINHLSTVAGDQSVVDIDALEDAFDLIVDHTLLERENASASAALNVLNNPAGLTERAMREAAAMTDVYANKRKYIRRSVKTFISAAKKNEILQRLKNMGVAIPHDELQEFLEEGILPSALFSLRNGSVLNLEKGLGKAAMDYVKEVAEPLKEKFEESKKEAEQEAAEEKQRSEEEERRKKAEQEGKTPEEIAAEEAKQRAQDNLNKTQGAMTNAQAYKKLVEGNKKLAILLSRYLDNAEFEGTQAEFLNSQEGARFVVVLKAIQEAYNNSESSTSVDVWLGSNESLQDPIIITAIEKYFSEFADPTEVIALMGTIGSSTTFDETTIEAAHKENEARGGYARLVYSDPESGIFVVEQKESSGIVDPQFTLVNNKGVPRTDIQKKNLYNLSEAVDLIENFKKGKAGSKKATRFTFDGVALKTGEVLVDENGNEYIVQDLQTLDEKGEAKGLNVVRKGAKASLRLQSMNGLSVKVAGDKNSSVRQKRLSETSRLDSLYFGKSSLVRALSDEVGQSVGLQQFDLTEEEFFNNVSFRVTFNSEYKSVDSADPSELANLDYGGNKPNTRIKLLANQQARERASVEVVFTDPKTGVEQVFAFINDPLQYSFVDEQGNPVTNFFTDEYFFGNVKNTEADFRKMSALYNDVLQKAQAKNTSDAVVEYREVAEEFQFRLAAPGYNFASTAEEKASFDSVREKLGYAPGEKVVVLDRKFINDSTVTSNGFQVIGGAFSNVNERKAYEAAVKNNPNLLNKLGRYVAVKLGADGNAVFVELSPMQLERATLEEAYQSLVERSKLAKETEAKGGQLDSKDWNDEFNQKFYIGYTGTYGNNQVQPFMVEFKLGVSGKLQLQIKPSTVNGKHVAKGFTFNIDELPADLSTFFQELNERIEANNPKRGGYPLPEMSVENFYEFITPNLTEEDLGKMKTNLRSEPLAERMMIIDGYTGKSAEEIEAEKAGKKASGISGLGAQSKTDTPDVPGASNLGKIPGTGSSNPLNALDAEIADLQERYDARKKELGRKARKDAGLKDMAQKLSDLKRKRQVANKVASGYTAENAEQLEDFLGWVRAVLPDFIKVETTDVILDRMVRNGMTVGRFFTEIKAAASGIPELNGVIEITNDSPFKYHEAFHSVFRMLLSDAEIQNMLKLGEKEMLASLKEQGITLNQALNKLKASSAMYEDMTRLQLKERLVEEYLADKFEEFKKNPRGTKTDTQVKSLFRKIIDFFINLFKDYPVAEFESVEDLFVAIDAGKFKTSPVASNQFTRAAEYSNNTANAVLEFGSTSVTNEQGESETIRQYLNSADSQYLLSGITAYVDKKRRDSEDSLEDIIDEALDRFANLFDENVRQEPFSNPDLARRAEQILSVINDPVASEVIVDYVQDQISKFDSVEAFMEESLAELQDELGGSAAESWAEEKESIGGLKSLPTLVRAVIGTTVVSEVDAFGNSFFIDENGVVTDEEITVAADAPTVYNGLVRLLADSKGDRDVFEKLNAYRKLHSKAAKKSQTVLFIDKLFETLGIIEDETSGDLDLTKIKNPQLFQAFSKAFDVSKRTYIFKAIDLGSGEVRVFESNRQNEGVVQYQVWQSAYDANYGNLTDKDIISIQEVLVDLGEMLDYETFDAQYATEKAQELAELTGIEISPVYLEYSFYRNKYNNGNLNLEAVNISSDIIYMITNSSSPAITKEDFTQIQNAFKVTRGKSLFLKTFDAGEINESEAQEKSAEEVVIQKSKYNVSSRLISLARGNVLFNENIETTTFSNARNKNIQTYQGRNVLTKIIQGLRDGATREQLLEDPYLANNHYLLNDEAFLEIVDQLNTKNIDGLANRDFESSSSLEVNKQQGKTYKSFSEREFLADSLLNYTEGRNEINGVTVSPVFIRVLESASTGMTVDLPVVDAVEYDAKSKYGFKFTDTYLQAIVNEVVRDLERIERVATEMRSDSFDRIENYNTGDLRGLKLGQIGFLLSPEVRAQLEQAAVSEDETIDLALIKREAGKGLEAAFEQYIGKLKEEKLLYTNKEGNLKAVRLIDAQYGMYVPGNSASEKKRNKGAKDATASAVNFVQGTKDEGPKAESRKLQHNLAQFFFSDFLNTLSMNQLIHGDAAESFKDGIDMVKRAKGYNVTGINAAHTIMPEDSNLRINHSFDKKGDLKHITFEDDRVDATYNEGSTDRDDGQLYMTVKGLRHVLFGMGRLTKPQADLLNKLEDGKKVTDSDVFGAFGKKGSVQFNAQTNSLKLVYFDGKNYLKMSAFLLTEEFTKRMNALSEGGDSFLNDLRTTLEVQEQSTDSVVFASPASASKARKKNIVTRADVQTNTLDQSAFNDLDPNFLYLSTENPSNKMKVNNPTQMRHIITGEYSNSDVVNVNGKEMSVGDLRREYLENDAHTLKMRYFNKRNQLFNIDDVKNEINISRDAGEITPKLQEFRKYAAETLKDLGASPQEIALFENEYINLNNPVTMKRFETLVLSMFSKQVIKDKLPGYKLTLVSDSGVKVIRQRGTAQKNGTSVDSVIPYEIFQKLSKEEQEGGDYYMDELRHNVAQYAKDGKTVQMRYSEMLMPPHKKDAIGLDGSIKESDMFGVRIPSQDKHSAVNLRVVDYIPGHYGSVGIFAKELIEISGADFDIDSLFVHRKESYVDESGQTVFYGEEKTVEQAFEGYIRSLVKTNPDVARTLKELNGSKYLQEVFDEGLVEDTDFSIADIRAAAKLVGLPSNIKEYRNAVKEEGRDINILAIQNRQVDLKMALLGSELMTKEGADGKSPKAYEAADTKPFDLFEGFLKDNNPAYLEILQAQERLVDSPLGKAAAFQDIREGAENIGPAVNTAIAYSVLNMYNVNSADQEKRGFTIGDKNYDSFTETVDAEGNRIMNNLSAVITAMTDNAKLQLARKYGLNIEAVGQLAYMLSTGVSFNTAVAFLNQPIIKEYYRSTANSSSVISVAADGSKKQQALAPGMIIKILKETVDANEDSNGSILTLDNLTANLGRSHNQVFFESVSGLSEETEQYKAEQAAVIVEFEKIRKQAEVMRKFASVAKIGAGVGKDLSEFNYKLETAEEFMKEDTLEEFAETGFPIGNLGNLMRNHDVIATEVQIAQELKVLFRSLFIKESPLVRSVYEMMQTSMTSSGTLRASSNEKLMNDILGALLGKAYMKANGTQKRLMRNLSNGMIYQSEQDNSAGVNNVTEIVGSLRRYLKAEGKDNKFIEELLYALPAVNPDGTPSRTKGVNQVKVNSWSKLSPEVAQRMESDIAELLSNTDAIDLPGGSTVREAVIDLVHYLFIKDGLTFKSGSFLNTIPAQGLARIFGVNDNVVNTLKSSGSIEASIYELLGVSVKEFISDHIMNWPVHASNNAGLNMKYIRNKRLEKTKPRYKEISETVLEVTNDNKFLNVDVFNKYNKEGAFDPLRIEVVTNAGFNQVANEEGLIQFEFPLYIKAYVNGKLQTLRLRTWTSQTFDSAQGKGKSTKNTLNPATIADQLINLKKQTGSYTIVGSVAQYEVVTLKGERAQTFGSAYVFGELPDYQAPKPFGPNLKSAVGKVKQTEETQDEGDVLGANVSGASNLGAIPLGKTASGASKANRIMGLGEENKTPEPINTSLSAQIGDLNAQLKGRALSVVEILPAQNGKPAQVKVKDLIGGGTYKVPMNNMIPSLNQLSDLKDDARRAFFLDVYKQLVGTLEARTVEGLESVDFSSAKTFADTLLTLVKIPGVNITLEDIVERIKKCYT